MLTIYPHPARRDAALARDGSAFLDDRCTIGELVRAVGAEALPGRRPVDRVGARIVLREVVRADPEATGPFAPIAHTSGFVRALARTFAAVAEADVTAPELGFAAVELADAAARARAQAVARLMDAHAAALAAAGLADAPALLAAAVRRLESGAPLPDRWRRAAAAGVRAVDVLDLSPARARLLRALGARLALPYDASRPGLFAYVAPAVAGGAAGYDPVDAGADPRLAALLRQLFRAGPAGAPAEDPGGTLGVTAAARAADEPRAIAARVRALLEAGAAPDDVAVALPGLDRHADRVRAALERYGVPVAERRGLPLAAAPPATLLLDLHRAARAGFPREALIALCTSRYVDPARTPDGRSAGHHVPALLRGAGARDDRAGGWAAALDAHLARAAARTPRPGEPAVPRALPGERAAAAHVAALVERLRPLGTAGPAAARLALLRDSADWLGLRARATVPWRGGAAEEPALARDQTAFDTALRLLDEVARTLGGAVLSPDELAAHLEDAFGAATIRASGVRGGAVVLMDVSELGGAAFPHVVLAALQDGRFPARGGGDPLLPDADRAALDRALGRPALRLDHRPPARPPPGGARPAPLDRPRGRAAAAAAPPAPPLPAREELDPLVFFLAAAAARRTLDLFYARTDDAGRALVRSPFVDEVLRVHPRGDALVATLPVAPIPAARDAARPDELRARVALEGGLTADGAPPPPGTAEALALAAIERGREQFFLGRPAPAAAPFVGLLAAPPAPQALAAAPAAIAGAAGRLLHAHVADTPAAPAWSAGRVSDYAKCGFRYFAHRVLRLRPVEDAGDELDPLNRGVLLHRVMEVAMRALDEAGLLPLAALATGSAAPGAATLDRALAVALAAAETALAAWEAGQLTGHAALWPLQREGALETLAALVRAEAEAPLFDSATPLRPSGFEVSFGAAASDALPPLALPAPDGAETIHFTGRIDRLDRSGDGAAGIVDYKSTALGALTKQVRADEIATGEFQLPVYLAVMAQAGARPLHAIYLSLRDRKATKDVAAVLGPPALAALLETDPARRAALRAAPAGAAPPANLADAVWRMAARMRAGDFAVRPRTCEWCDYQNACRVQLHARGDADPP